MSCRDHVHCHWVLTSTSVTTRFVRKPWVQLKGDWYSAVCTIIIIDRPCKSGSRVSVYRERKNRVGNCLYFIYRNVESYCLLHLRTLLNISRWSPSTLGKVPQGAWSSFSQVQMCQPSLCLVSRHDKMLQELEVQLASQMLASNVSFPPSSGSQMLSVVFVLISQYVTGLWISVEI